MSVSPCSALISFLLACFSLRRLSSSCSGKNLIVKVIRDVNRGVAIKAKTCLLLGALLPPFVDVLLQLLVQLALLRLLARLQEVPISPDSIKHRHCHFGLPGSCTPGMVYSRHLKIQTTPALRIFVKFVLVLYIICPLMK